MLQTFLNGVSTKELVSYPPPHSPLTPGLGYTNGNRFDLADDLTDAQLARMKELSPAMLTYDQTSKTKVLLLIGDSDKRVSPRAAYYLYRKLKKIGLDIVCKDYKNQGHGIRKIDFYFDY